MSVQYRPDLKGGGSSSRESVYLQDTANSQQVVPGYYPAKQAYTDKAQQRQAHVQYELQHQMENQQGSPISPLSPPDSSQAASDIAPSSGQGWSPVSFHSETSFRSEVSLESKFHTHEDAEFYGQPNGELSSHHSTSSSSAMLAPTSSQSTVTTHSSFNTTTYNLAARNHVAEQQYAQQAHSGYAKKEMHSDVAHMLQVLENALLDDDDDEDETDLAASLSQRHNTLSADGGWADTLEELLAVERTSPLDSQSHEVSATAAASAQSPSSSDSYSTAVPEDVKAVMDTRSQSEQLLVACAEAVANNDLPLANVLIAQLHQVVSIYGNPMQRLAAYMMEGLIARIASTGKGLYKALRCKEAPTADLLSAMQILYEVCPYFKFGYMAANGAIAEAFQNEQRVHIIDFEIAQGGQWMTLIQALAARPGGPPHLRITGVDDPASGLAGMSPTGGVELVGIRLRNLAQAVGVPFVFHPVAKNGTQVQEWMLERQPGEALAVNFALQLHHMPDESVCTTNPRDRILRMVKSLRPKVVTLVEHEANTNTAPFLPRFMETLSYYSAIFESLDITLARESQDRVKVEQNCLARDIVNVIACEGSERVERYELLGKWKARMTMAGFQPYPLSSSVNRTIKTLLESYSDKYRLKEEGAALLLGWMNRPLVVASAWH
ncbi:hypothetical protein CY35_05G028400 [Sphagnum magellanicum]|nr:hypothetical protein CY35_05G028400 [Sphagnum magellanicum]